MDEVTFRSPADLVGEPDPVKRVRFADELAEASKRLAGEFYRVRREAVAELAAATTNAEAARLLGVHRNKTGDAVKQVAADDRELFDDALQVLARDGASGASSTELMRGLAVAELAPKARRVQFGEKHVVPSALSADELTLVGRAARRAAAVLDGRG